MLTLPGPHLCVTFFLVFLPTCMYVHRVYVCAMPAAVKRTSSKEDIKSPGTEITDGSKIPYGFWELNLGLLQEQQLFLTVSHFSSQIR